MVLNVLHVRVAQLNCDSKEADAGGVQVVIPVRVIGLLSFYDLAHDMHPVCFLARHNSSRMGDLVLVGKLEDELLIPRTPIVA
jgi:hypothetical protein